MEDYRETGGHKEDGLELSLAAPLIPAGIIICAEDSMRFAGCLLLFGGIASIVAPSVIEYISKAYKSIIRK